MTLRRFLHWRALVALALPLVLAACITIGQKFRPQQVELIKKGETTNNEVLKLLGNPMRTGFDDNGLREWTYAYYRAGAFSGLEGHDLVVKFLPDGTVKSFSYHSTDPHDPVIQEMKK